MKYIKFFLNGKEVTKEVISKRKNKKLSEVVIVEEKYYTAPLTEKEKEQKIIAAKNSTKFFNELRTLREDQEKFH